MAAREANRTLRELVTGWRRPSVIVLIAANLIPLSGVLFLGWGVFPIMFLFWLENVVIGVFNVLRIFLASPGEQSKWLSKVFVVPFFVVHYGGFALGHGTFVIALFGPETLNEGGGWPLTLDRVRDILGTYHLGYALLALVASHGFSFVWNYIGKGEYRHASPQELMGRPYGRVVVLHVVIILGALLIGLFGTPVAALLLLVVLKIVIDVLAHLREHRKMGAIPTHEAAAEEGASREGAAQP